MVYQVRVAPYDERWPALFAAEETRLSEVFGSLAAAIHHIGSTSVPGLAAKPIVDILVEVIDVGAVDGLGQAMSVLGYEAMGEFGLPGRRYFRKGGDQRTHQVHVFAAGSSEAVRHLAFRDYLRAHPEEAAAYGRLKTELARRHPTDIQAYMDGKDVFVKELEARALAWRNGRIPPA